MARLLLLILKALNTRSPRIPKSSPAYSPELIAQENIRNYLRQNYLAGGIFDTYDDIVDACRSA
jgi:hypothetical protein